MILLIISLYLIVVITLLYLNYKFWKHIKNIEGDNNE